MNARDLTLLVPDEGGASILDIASRLDADADEVAKMACRLQEHALFTVDGDDIRATDILRRERDRGVLPRHRSAGSAKEKRHALALEKADSLCFKANPVKVVECMSLFGAGAAELKRRFKLSDRDAEPIFRHLRCEGFLESSDSRKLFLFKKADYRVPDDAAAIIRRRYAPSAAESMDRTVYKTKVDVLADLVLNFSPLRLADASRHLEVPSEELLPALEALHEKGIVRLRHVGGSSVIERTELTGKREEADECRFRRVSAYSIEKGGVTLKASLVEDIGETRFLISLPTFKGPTQSVLEWIYEKANPGGMESEVRSSSDFESVKGMLRGNIADAVSHRLSFVDGAVREVMVCELANELRLGRLEYLLSDPNIEEIKAQSGRPVFIKHIGCQQEWVETNITLDADLLKRYAKAIARETAQQVDSSHPLMDAVLHTGDRVNVSMPDVAGGSIVLEIRVFSKKPWNFVRLVKKGTVNPEVMAFLWLGIQYKFNILVSGETGSGKTSFVNALSVFLPKNDHIVSVEDTREIQLPSFYKNWTHMTTKNGNSETEVTMSRLLVNALRMDPSFIIMGEVRSRQDIETLTRATAMGHPVMSTVHTRDCSTTIKRFEDAGVTATDLANIHINVILEAVKAKEENRTKRRLKEVGEYVLESQGVSANRVFRLDMNSDRIVRVNEPRSYDQRVMDRVNMNRDDIRRDLRDKQRIIEWLVSKDVQDINVLGRVIQLYYLDPGRVLEAAASGGEMDDLFKDGGYVEFDRAENSG